jgi:hypothetical protein
VSLIGYSLQNPSLTRYSHCKLYFMIYSLCNVCLMNRRGSSVSKLRSYEIKCLACVPFLSDTALVYVQPKAEQGHQHVCHLQIVIAVCIK